MPDDAPQLTARQRWMGLLARADAGVLGACTARLAPLPAATVVRGPEPGLVLVRGRTGASGAPFNLGEMTVTRCAVRLEDGTVGHAYVSGRDHDKARTAAVLDALLLGATAGASWPGRIEAVVLTPLEAIERQRRAAQARKSAATRVEFFTMVRSEHGGRD